MLFARQRSLPFTTRSTLPLRQQIAALESARPRAARGADVAVRERVVAAASAIRPAHVGRQATPRTAVRPGRDFAAKRIAHAAEMFGACMMIATFLVLALFA